MRNVDYVNLDTDLGSEVLPNGFLSILANLSRTGIFQYQQIAPDGTISILRQLRLPDEVFAESTMASLAGLPITNNHPDSPSKLVTPENASDFIVGMASDNPKRVLAPVQGDSEEYVQQRLTIFDEDTQTLIRKKEKTQMSLGYSCELDFEPGVYKGENYDAIQRNIRVNHGSIVQQARGGSSCKILMDGKETVVNVDGVSHDENINPKKELDVKIQFDGKEFDEAGVKILLDSLQSKIGAGGELSTAKQKEIDKLTAICDDMKAKIKVQDSDDNAANFRAAVKERVSLESRGASVLGDLNLDALSDREIKEKVIEKLRPATVLDGKSDDYVEARFDICVEDHAKDPENKMGKNIQNADGGDEDVVAKAKAAAWARAKDAWKTEASK
jgi:hypothetical protein